MLTQEECLVELCGANVRLPRNDEERRVKAWLMVFIIANFDEPFISFTYRRETLYKPGLFDERTINSMAASGIWCNDENVIECISCFQTPNDSFHGEHDSYCYYNKLMQSTHHLPSLVQLIQQEYTSAKVQVAQEMTFHDSHILIGLVRFYLQRGLLQCRRNG